MTVTTPTLPTTDPSAHHPHKALTMPRISKTTLGVIGLVLGVGVGLFVFRHEISGMRSPSARRRLERAVQEFIANRAHDARQLDLHPPRFSGFDSDSQIGRLLSRWRD